ncbi:hypothetical protein [Yoonia sp. SS1-5]|uniref:Lipoprotein n=1 Tax=Yoonia rhodophyticola TaxID=3137370 RepID=A0AAN0M9K2_9RHOB
MVRTALILLGSVFLIGCGDPFSDLDLIGDVEGGGPASLGFIGTQNREVDVEVTADQVVPYGRIARNCTVSRRDMGKSVTDASGYTIYDTAPNSTGLRTHFITGFRDGCARQFSGALVITGDVGTHEMVRYADVGLKQPYTITDEAYEVIKGSFCRVARLQPCGRRIDRLAKTTAFVTVYESFGNNANWSDVLLHRGEVVAKDVNGR